MVLSLERVSLDEHDEIWTHLIQYRLELFSFTQLVVRQVQPAIVHGRTAAHEMIVAMSTV